jgi:hypothetical protein
MKVAYVPRALRNLEEISDYLTKTKSRRSRRYNCGHQIQHLGIGGLPADWTDR